MKKQKSCSRVDKLVEVEWEDAWSSGEVYSKKELNEEGVYVIKTVGICLLDDARGIGLAREQHQGLNKYRHVNFIPAGMIQKVRILTYK